MKSSTIAAYDLTINYSYDSLSRLLSADYNKGANVYNYGYDVAGNMVNYDGTTRTYNAANQLINDGTNTLTYDNNGNLTAVGADSYTWDRANRLLSHGGISYAYDGAGNRISQNTLKYLLDVQPGLTVVLGDSDGNHFVHAVRGILAQEDNLGNWEYMAQDGLGSVRGLLDDAAVVQSSMSYDPYGNPMGSYGAGFGFTGEQVDDNNLVFLRARYMNPNIGTFLSLDPFEGVHGRPMSLNGYSWVEGNVPNAIDVDGMQADCPPGFVCPVDLPLIDNPVFVDPSIVTSILSQERPEYNQDANGYNLHLAASVWDMVGNEIMCSGLPPVAIGALRFARPNAYRGRGNVNDWYMNDTQSPNVFSYREMIAWVFEIELHNAIISGGNRAARVALEVVTRQFWGTCGRDGNQLCQGQEALDFLRHNEAWTSMAANEDYSRIVRLPNDRYLNDFAIIVFYPELNNSTTQLVDSQLGISPSERISWKSGRQLSEVWTWANRRPNSACPDQLNGAWQQIRAIGATQRERGTTISPEDLASDSIVDYVPIARGQEVINHFAFFTPNQQVYWYGQGMEIGNEVCS